MTGRRTLLAGWLTALLVAVLAVALLGPAARDRNDGSPAAATASDRPDSVRPSSPAPVTNGKGSEVIEQPAGSGQQRLPGLSTRKATSTALIGKPLPATASSRGRVVPGFPLEITPLIPDSTVRSSGISSTANALQLSLQATSSRAPDRVLAFYRSAFSGHGFSESALPAVGGSTAAGFNRQGDNLTVTVTKSRGGSSYSVYGTLHAGKTK